jgi:hypothetical protein
MIQIIAIRMSGGTTHQHITDLKWENTSTTSQGESSRQQVVDWLSIEGNQAIVRAPSRTVYVGVVRPAQSSAYLRTYADGVWTDNLLALQRF